MDINDFLSAGFETFIRLAELLLAYLKVLAWPASVLLLAFLFRRPLIDVLERLRKAAGFNLSVELEAQARALAEDSAEIAEDSAEIADAEKADPDPADHTRAPNGTSTATATDPAPDTQDDPPTTEPPTTEPNLPANTSHPKPEPTKTPRPFPTDEQLRELLEAMRKVQRQQGIIDREIRKRYPRRTAKTPVAMLNEMSEAWLELEAASVRAAINLGLSPNLGHHIPSLIKALANGDDVPASTVDVADRLFTLHRRLRDSPAIPSLDVAQDYITTTRNLTQVIRTATATGKDSGE